MVNDLAQLMRDSADDVPPGDVDVAHVVATGRGRVRRRRRTVGAVALSTAAVLVVALLDWGGPGGDGRDRVAGGPPRPDAPTLRLADATAAVEGTDYEVVTSYTNEDLNTDNGQYLDGVTDDGLVLVRDEPSQGRRWPRMALLDPATGAKDWLPDVEIDQQTWPVELSEQRLVLLAMDEFEDADDDAATLLGYVYDREVGSWRTMSWPGLPGVGFAGRSDVGPDGRLYVTTPDTHGRVPEGGWPIGVDGEAEDADAEGDTYRLWSVSLTDPDDVRDEQLVVGDVAFTDEAMVWTDATNGDAGEVHVRDLAGGAERSFDPQTGERCNLLGFGATGERIVMSQYCGTYADGGRDDRVQVLTTDGEQVVTLQDDGAEGWLPAGSDVVNVSVFAGEESGTYAYDLGTDRFLRLSEEISSFGLGGPTGRSDEIFWHTPVNHRNGATQWLGRLLD